MVNVMDIVCNTFRTTEGEKISEDDVIAVWKTIIQQIEENLCKGYALSIQGFGTFTLSEWKLHNGGKTCVQILAPIFILSNKLALFYHVKVHKSFTTYKIPTKVLNISLLAHKCRLKREDIEFIIGEIIQVFVQLIGNNQDADIKLPGIGKIEVKNKIINSTFDEAFLEKIRKENSCNDDVNVGIQKFYTFPYNSGNFWTL